MFVLEVCIGVVMGLLVSSPLVIWLLARFDCCFTLKVEGKAKAIIKGKTPVGFVFSLSGHKMLRTQGEVEAYNEKNKLTGKGSVAILWDLVPLEEDETVAPVTGGLGKRWFSYFCDALGVQWIGPWPWYQIYWYPLRCSMIEVNENGETGEKRKDSQSCFVYLNRTMYYSKVRCVTHKEENINLIIEYFFALACRNPYVALFGNDEWFINLTAMTDAKAVRFAANLRYEAINVDANTNTMKDEDAFAKKMLTLAKEVRRKIGFVFDHTVIFKKTPGDAEATKFVEAIAKPRIAERVGDAELKAAEKRALVATEEAKGEAAHYKARTDATAVLMDKVTEGVGSTSGSLEGKSIQAAIAAAIIPLTAAVAGQMMTTQQKRQEGDR